MIILLNKKKSLIPFKVFFVNVNTFKRDLKKNYSEGHKKHLQLSNNYFIFKKIIKENKWMIF